MGSRPWSGFQLTLEYFWLRDVQIPPTLYLDSSNRHWTLTVHQADTRDREDHKNGIFDNTCIKKEFGISRDSELFSSISNKINQNSSWRWGGRGRWSKPDKNWFQHRASLNLPEAPRWGGFDSPGSENITESWVFYQSGEGEIWRRVLWIYDMVGG